MNVTSLKQILSPLGVFDVIQRKRRFTAVRIYIFLSKNKRFRKRKPAILHDS